VLAGVGVAWRRQRLADGEAAGVEVDIRPAQPEDLAAAHPGRRPEQDRDFELVASQPAEEAGELGRGPGRHVVAGALGEPLSDRLEAGDVAGQPAFGDRVRQGLGQDHVQVVDAAGRQATRPVQAPVGVEVAVEG
jgi:hypothetical protein